MLEIVYYSFGFYGNQCLNTFGVVTTNVPSFLVSRYITSVVGFKICL